jgi:hypothetical protein
MSIDGQAADILERAADLIGLARAAWSCTEAIRRITC